MQFNQISLFVLICGVLSFGIALIAWRRRSVNGAMWFSLFMVALSIYITAYGFELASFTLPYMLFWNKIQYIGIGFFPTLYFIFTLQFTHREHLISPQTLAPLLIIAAGLVTAKLFDESWRLYYTSVYIYLDGPIPLLGFTNGPLYLLAGVYHILIIGLSIFLMWSARKSSSPLYRKQTNVILPASVLLYTIYLVYLSGYSPFPVLKHFDYNPFVYTILGISVAWAIFKDRLFELVPFAREKLIETLGAGVLVFDSRCRMVDANPAGKTIFRWKQVPNGWSVEQVFEGWVCSSASEGKIYESNFLVPGTIEIQCEREGKKVWYDVNITELKGDQNKVDGRLIVMHDISSRKAIEQQLHDLSLEDELTGLKNRRGFFTLATQMIQMVRRMKLSAVLIYIDMDDLKGINDNQGHAEGDRAIMAIGQALLRTCRSSDIIARLGGDEFVILAIGSEANLPDIMIERLEEGLQLLENENQLPYKLSFSYGIAACNPDFNFSLESMLEDADAAMYEQKQNKKKT